ncbi:hypothetical protein PtA15_1A640 [Puccinia triticina]|uniref:Uncharacterized protein n=1 Tax=Puccinia triticina TaxID=208348 RepID=A0ABY7C928_9BASI|nr:uncharacterized protein PtA15_1A640 [Puccinia triticina]WAQ81300.1 hypothetical protein PtA15_1A640 [Puccinia triticina]WAR52188.1 hypothetical protein PtB15_1B627 [Puccinia triticina]
MPLAQVKKANVEVTINAPHNVAAAAFKEFVVMFVKQLDKLWADCEERIKLSEEEGRTQVAFFDLTINKDDIEVILPDRG